MMVVLGQCTSVWFHFETERGKKKHLFSVSVQRKQEKFGNSLKFCLISLKTKQKMKKLKDLLFVLFFYSFSTFSGKNKNKKDIQTQLKELSDFFSFRCWEKKGLSFSLL